jgi:hypothetical protein
MERLDQGYLHPNLVVRVLKYPGRESNQGHPRWEASTLERNHSNSLLTDICLHPRQDIFYIYPYITGNGIYVKKKKFLHYKNLGQFTGIPAFGGKNTNRCNERFTTVPCQFA